MSRTEAFAAAIAHHRAGRIDEAERLYRMILDSDPGAFHAWHMLGVVASQSGKPELGAEHIQQAIALRPNFAEAHYNLGRCLQEMGKQAEAIDSYRQAVALEPQLFSAHLNLGAMLHEVGQLAEAVESYGRALAIKPDDAEAHNNLGNVFRSLGRMDDAVSCLRRAVQLRPDYADAEFNLGMALQESGLLSEAIVRYQRALRLDPRHASAMNNLGTAYQEDGQFRLAADCYRQAVAQDALIAGAHSNLATLLLMTGDFQAGWLEYEWRWKTGEFARREFPLPRWNGEPIKGRTVFLWAEQGYGDTIQFIRYARLVKELGAKVVLECQEPLLKVLAGCSGVSRMIAPGRAAVFDVHAPLLSLPGIFGTSMETIPADVPYVFAEPGLIELWRERLRYASGFRIGINWAGRADTAQRKQRDIPIEHFAALAELPGVRLISLQKGSGDPSLALRACVVDFGDELDTQHGAFMDTAAIMMNLDLVITSDTSVAHLAGALGVPVWVALPFVRDWRWMLERSDSPWYPTMRLFRQKSRGDWAGVFQEIETALRERLGK
jgi:tetratricopeptide (TPR) repeat protein